MAERATAWPGGPTIGTFLGGYFNVLNPAREDVKPHDIAHALARLCRFGGHSVRFYSVAEHTRRMYDEAASRRWPKEMLSYVLLHDAAEAYIGDLPRPIKREFSIKEIEHHIYDVILCAFGISEPDDNIRQRVKNLDDDMLAAECEQLMAPIGVCKREAWQLSGIAPDVAFQHYITIENEEAWMVGRLLELWDVRNGPPLPRDEECEAAEAARANAGA